MYRRRSNTAVFKIKPIKNNMTTATEMLNLYIDAEAKVLQGQEVMMNGRKMTRANLTEIRKGRQEWQQRVNAEQQAQRGQSSFAYADFTNSAL